MRSYSRLFSFLVVVSAMIFFSLPVTTLAGGGVNAPASPKPRPDQTVKVWTNDDLATLGPPFEAAGQPAPSEVPTTSNRESAPSARAPQATPVAPEQNPRWYAGQLSSLESELAEVESREQRLSQFRATGSGLQTGLNVVAPCEGVGTDNLIARLDARRQEILQQIDALGDTARSSGMEPGILVEGRGRVAAEEPPTAGERRADLLEQHGELSEQLARTQGVESYMQEDTARRNMTLLRPALGGVGNMTSNLLHNLDNRANALQGQISNVEDEALASGVEPGTLR